MESVEIKQKPDSNKKEKVSLYRERVVSGLDRSLERIKSIISGERPKLKLDAEQKERVLKFENELGEKLEGIYGIQAVYHSFYVEYFQTPEGVKDLAGIADDAFGSTIEEITGNLFAKRDKIYAADGKLIDEIEKRSKKYSEESLSEKILQIMDADGSFNVESLRTPKKIDILSNPEEMLLKIEKLRALKKELKEKYALLESDEAGGDEAVAKMKWIDIYTKRANEMLAGQFSSGVWAKRLADEAGENALTESERKLLSHYTGLKNFEHTYARYDKFVHGAAAEYDEKGRRRQVSSEMARYADSMDERYIESEIAKSGRAAEKGLDYSKLTEKNITAENFIEWGEEMLEAMGEKSVIPAEEYDKERKSPAADGKWQLVVRPKYNTEVKAWQKVITTSTGKASIQWTLPTLLGHEFTHVKQHLNNLLSIRMFEKVGGDRGEAFSEGGAMLMQDRVSKELFGYGSCNHPHYIRAMMRRLEGGSYLDCVKAFYDSSLKVIQRKKDLGAIDEQQFAKEIKSAVKTAIDRARRLFSNNTALDSSGSELLKSKDTVYIEQMALTEKMIAEGLEKCLFVSGMNLETMAELLEMGLLDLDKIEEVDISPIKKIWEREKEKYLLSDGVPTDEQKIEKVRMAIASLDK